MKTKSIAVDTSSGGVIIEADITESEFNKMDVSASRFMTHEDGSIIISGDFILFEASCFNNGIGRVKFESTGKVKVIHK